MSGGDETENERLEAIERIRQRVRDNVEAVFDQLAAEPDCDPGDLPAFFERMGELSHAHFQQQLVEMGRDAIVELLKDWNPFAAPEERREDASPEPEASEEESASEEDPESVTDRTGIRRLLEECVGRTLEVRIDRGEIAEECEYGLVAGIGKEWLILVPYQGLLADGYYLLRVADLVEVRISRFERFRSRILELEGTRPLDAEVLQLPLDGAAELLEAIRQRGRNVIVECEKRDHDDDEFYIGRVLANDGAQLTFAHFEADGVWDERASTVELGGITRVQLDTHYTQMYSRHLLGSMPEA